MGPALLPAPASPVAHPAVSSLWRPAGTHDATIMTRPDFRGSTIDPKSRSAPQPKDCGVDRPRRNMTALISAPLPRPVRGRLHLKGAPTPLKPPALLRARKKACGCVRLQAEPWADTLRACPLQTRQKAANMLKKQPFPRFLYCEARMSCDSRKEECGGAGSPRDIKLWIIVDKVGDKWRTEDGYPPPGRIHAAAGQAKGGAVRRRPCIA